VSQQAASNEVYFIGAGRVRATIFTFCGKEISYQELGAGETFGELSAIDKMPRTVNVITVEPSQIGVISANNYWKLIEQYPSIARATLKRMASMVRFLIDRVYQYGALDVRDRVRMEVLRLARESMTGEDTAIIQDFPTHKEIASRVNTHREAVTRELNELSRTGLIEQDHRVLMITSIERMSELLDESM
jgi:CRP-like cAMP-binding protein